MTLPVILGWMEQKYGYVPAFSNLKENFSSESSTLDLNTFGSSALTTVCGMSSRLVQVTVVPTATVKAAGPKLKLSIFTSGAWFCCSAAARSLRRAPPIKIPTAINTATDTLLLMVFFSPFYFSKSFSFRKPSISPERREIPPLRALEDQGAPVG